MGRLSATVLVASLLLAPAVASALPEDEAADAAALGTPVGEGSHGGRVGGPHDLADHYALDVPAFVVLRFAFDGTGDHTVKLTDPEGDLRLCDKTPRRGVYSTFADVPGRWTLSVDFSECGGIADAVPTGVNPIVVDPVDYAFTVAFERHEHVARIEAPRGLARTLHAEFPNGTFARVDVNFRAHANLTGAWAGATWVRVEDEGGHVSSGGGGGAWRPYAGFGTQQVHVSGLPAGVHVNAPMPDPRNPSGWGVVENDAGGAVTVDVGVASSDGFTAVAWATWDGDVAFPVGFATGDRAVFASVADFRANGPFVQAGPYTRGDGLSLSWKYGGGPSFVFTDVTLPQWDPWMPHWSLAESTMTVRPPDQDPVVLHDRFCFWNARASDAGEWRVEVDRVDGFWDDALLFGGVEFDMPPLGADADEGPVPMGCVE